MFNKIILKLLLVVIFSFAAIMPANAIKIGVSDFAKQGYIATSNSGYIVDENSHQVIYKIRSMKKYQLKPYKDSIIIDVDGKYYDLQTSKVRIKPETTRDFVSTKNKWYRGELLILNHGDGLSFINDIDLEYYLLGVVPSEMPSSWNEEAHKAQAIAARSYALANLGKRASRGYDLKDTPEDQAYGGASSETQRTNVAVIATKGLVLTYDNKIIPAYYHASAGGCTKDSGSVWFKNLPYLKAVPSFDSGIPKNGHGVGMSQYGANNLAASGYNAFQILGYFYKDVSIDRLSN